MAERIGNNYYLLVNAVNLSAWLEDLQINREHNLETFVTSTATDPPYERNLGGVAKLNVVATFSDDFATSAPHQTLKALVGTPFTVVAALNGATPSAENEVLTDTMTFGGLPSGGAVGSRLKKQITFVHASGTPVFDITP